LQNYLQENRSSFADFARGAVVDQNVDMEIAPSLHVETPNIPKQQAPENSEEEEEVHHEASRFHLLQHPKQDLQEASERDIPSVVGAKAKMQS